MQSFVMFRQIAEECARMRDAAASDLARARLERERLDWLQLAHDAGLARRAAEIQARLSKRAVSTSGRAVPNSQPRRAAAG